MTLPRLLRRPAGLAILVIAALAAFLIVRRVERRHALLHQRPVRGEHPERRVVDRQHRRLERIGGRGRHRVGGSHRAGQ